MRIETHPQKKKEKKSRYAKNSKHCMCISIQNLDEYLFICCTLVYVKKRLQTLFMTFIADI